MGASVGGRAQRQGRGERGNEVWRGNKRKKKGGKGRQQVAGKKERNSLSQMLILEGRKSERERRGEKGERQQRRKEGRGKHWEGKAGEERVKRESKADAGREGLRSGGC